MEGRFQAFQQKNLRAAMRHGGGSIKVWECFAAAGTDPLTIMNSTNDQGVHEEHVFKKTNCKKKKLKQKQDSATQPDGPKISQ